jgi:alpha-L-fucosidase
MKVSRRRALGMIGGAVPAFGLRGALGQMTESGAQHVPPSASVPARADGPSQSPVAEGFDTYTEDYARFCATPADQRVFYALDGGKIESEKLDQKTWLPTRSPAKKNLPLPGGSWDDVPLESPFAENLSGNGPYQPTWDSLLQYNAPDWYRDAKFGIWAHWSPQCVPEQGDWYARQMYIEGSPQYKFHLEHYGHPSRFGYKDLCAQWTLLNWQPDELMERYKRAGAKFFLALANHHDSFDTWNSKHQPWNSVNVGPHRDVVGAWAAAARSQDLRFGVTVHQARNWWWLQTSHDSDKAGPFAGIPYDGRMTIGDGKEQWWEGLNPQMLYCAKHPFNALPDISWVKNFYDRTRDLIDQHDPDLLYFDNPLFPLGWAGMNIGAYFYNHYLHTHAGKMDGVINIKTVPERYRKAVVADYERGITDRIMPYPWQSETCIGSWHYQRTLFDKAGEFGGYMQPRDAIHWLIDTVSKNGTFVLDIPGKPDGTLDSKEIAVLDGIAAWMDVNREAIYATRPWTVYGEGPDMVKSGSFQGNSVKTLGPKDIRFTRDKANTVVYAMVLGWPAAQFVVESFGTKSLTQPGKIAQVQLLGTDEKIQWNQTGSGLYVQLPPRYRPDADYAATLKITL